MSNFSSPYNVQAIALELEARHRDLNLIVGPLSLSITIGCLSLTFWPGLFFGALGLLVLFSVTDGGIIRRSHKLDWLRKAASDDWKAAEVLEYVEREFLGIWQNFSFLSGGISLMLVTAWRMCGLCVIASGALTELPWLSPLLPPL